MYDGQSSSSSDAETADDGNDERLQHNVPLQFRSSTGNGQLAHGPATSGKSVS